jgi:hypothetical protein
MPRSPWIIAALSTCGAAALSTSAMACGYGDCGRYGYVYASPPAVIYAPFAVVEARPVYIAPPVVTYAPPRPVYGYVRAPSCASGRIHASAPPYAYGYAPGWGGYASYYPERRWRGW